MVKAKKYILERRFDGVPQQGDLKIVEEELPPIKDGEFLAEAIYLSVDPYMQIAVKPQLKSTFVGEQVAKIIESKHPKYAVGQHIVGNFGWRTHTVSNGDGNISILPDFEGLPLSLGLGVLGMTGNSSYFGFLEICKPKAGETVVISAAAGAIGSHVGQIAKIKGCKVIGFAGSDEKGKWLTEELGFDHFINYKTQNVEEELKKAAPEGVDCYFDNVGGELSSTVIYQMNNHGRVSVCGAISEYNDRYTKARAILRRVVWQQLKIEGFVIWNRWKDQWDEAVLQNLRWIKEGKLKYRETVTNGFENMFEAFVDMLKGGNTGKAIVKV